MAAAVHSHLFEVDRQKRHLSLERGQVVSLRGFPELSGGEREIGETPHRTQRHLVSVRIAAPGRDASSVSTASASRLRTAV